MFVELVRAAGEVVVPSVDIGAVRHRRLAADATAFIEAHYAQPLTLADIAQHVFTSPYHFARVFKDATGQSPMAYLTDVRMARAKGLLVEGDLTVKEIAAAVGYRDAHYFSRAFRREQGVSPSDYRRSHRLR